MTQTRQMFRVLGRAAAIALPALMASSVALPAQAQISLSIGIGFDIFHDRLAPYGRWSNHPRWGQVWHPRASSDFRPYYNGHWANTREYGWMWVSDESWGDVTYHYGRWVRDPNEGWLWVPGYVWGPSWVVWRSGGGNIGWFPMPPGDDYYGDGAYRGNYDDEYGYRDWYGPGFDNNQFLSLWVFVGENHFGDRNFRNYAVPQRDYGRFIGQTRDSTNYTTVNNYVVNRSVDANSLRQDTKQRFEPVPARSVIRDTALIAPVPAGRQIEQRERQQHPIPAATRMAPASPAAAQPNANQVPQGPQGRGNNRNPAAAGTAPPVPQAERRGPGTAAPAITPAAPAARPAPSPASPPQDRGGRANQQIDRGVVAPQAPRVAPAAPTAQPIPVAPPANPPQDRSGRGNQQIDRGVAAPQAPRVAPAAPTVQPIPATPPANPPPDRGGRGNQQPDRGVAAPQAPRIAPAAPTVQPIPATPPANPPPDRSGRANQQPDRGAAAPQTRAAPEQGGRGAGAQAPARAPDNAPAAQDRGTARGNRQNDKAGDQNAAVDKKDSGRGPN